MLTLFTSTRAFRGHFGVIQRNALYSWTLLRPRPEILVFGNEAGAAEVSSEFGLRNLPEIATNEFGTPLLSEIFRIACSEARHPLLCYMNADIIVTSRFQAGVSCARKRLDGRAFLLAGRRWNVFVNEPWDFSRRDWEERLAEYARSHGYQESAGAIEYFLFPKSVTWEIPPFALGRGPWDAWLLYNAHQRGLLTVDATPLITVYHQQHDFSHWREGGKKIWKAEEFRRGEKLRGSFTRQYNLWDSRWVLTDKGLEARTRRRAAKAHLLRARMFLAHCVHAAEPYSYPLLAGYRAARKLARSFKA
jgi:hypothetical protein